MSDQSHSLEGSSKSTESTSEMETPLTMENENSSNRQLEISPSSTRKKKLPGRWKPGQSGNPAGRPQGSKNQVSILKTALEYELRNKAKPHMLKVLQKAIELALEGDRMMIKLLLELHMSRQVHSEDESGGKSKVAVVIQNLTETPPSQPIQIIEGK